MTDTADLADYVLPATTQLEHLDLQISYGHTYALINEPAIAPLGEARPNTEIFRAAGGADGLRRSVLRRERRGRWPGSPSSRRRAAASTSPTCASAAGSKLAIAEAPFAEGGFATPNGKCRIDAPGLGVPDHLPNYESAASTPELAARFPLAMISPPERNFLNSTFVNVASLRGIDGEPVLEIDAGDAAARGIASRARRCGSSTTAARSSAGPWSGRAPGRAWSTAWACGGGSSRPTAATATS